MTARISTLYGIENQQEPYMFDPVAQLEIFPRTLDLRRIDVARNMRRYYRLSVQRDLFGRACLIREWGRIGARGQSLIERHEDEGKAITSLMRLAAQKQRRGYQR
jgi:predicted DNA-binding WGR domain protein